MQGLHSLSCAGYFLLKPRWKEQKATSPHCLLPIRNSSLTFWSESGQERHHLSHIFPFFFLKSYFLYWSFWHKQGNQEERRVNRFEGMGQGTRQRFLFLFTMCLLCLCTPRWLVGISLLTLIAFVSVNRCNHIWSLAEDFSLLTAEVDLGVTKIPGSSTLYASSHTLCGHWGAIT